MVCAAIQVIPIKQAKKTTKQTNQKKYSTLLQIVWYFNFVSYVEIFLISYSQLARSADSHILPRCCRDFQEHYFLLSPIKAVKPAKIKKFKPEYICFSCAVTRKFVRPNLDYKLTLHLTQYSDNLNLEGMTSASIRAV